MSVNATILKPLTFYQVVITMNAMGNMVISYGTQTVCNLASVSGVYILPLYFKTGLQNQSLTITSSATGSVVFNEIMLSPYVIDDYQQKTVTYSERSKNWVGNYSIYPEMFCRVNDLVIAMNGGVPSQLYAGPGFNNFFGQQYDTRVVKVFNSDVAAVKYMESISVEANLSPDYTHLQTLYANGYPGQSGAWIIQSTDLYASDLNWKNGIWYGTYFRDRLTPPAATGQQYDNNLYTGDKMRSQYAFVFLQYITVNYNLVLNAANIGYIMAGGTQTIPSR